ncbi:hypothetical protein AVEN_97529-1 [Araneus ventricosus]|uniref:Uncharacterized protein n=1 Tax=Araneus ventricosus TaxID=182803 RepID=A0A4Y2KNX8_ARAVE|nr:hypothetical protein AVEN_97529-1 [Araneus ventricosus]
MVLTYARDYFVSPSWLIIYLIFNSIGLVCVSYINRPVLKHTRLCLGWNLGTKPRTQMRATSPEGGTPLSNSPRHTRQDVYSHAYGFSGQQSSSMDLQWLVYYILLYTNPECVCVCVKTTPSILIGFTDNMETTVSPDRMLEFKMRKYDNYYILFP